MLTQHLTTGGKINTDPPSLQCILEGYTEINHPTNSTLMTTFNGGSYQVINETYNEVWVIDGQGITSRLPPARKNRNRVVVIKTIEFGLDSSIDLTASFDNMPGDTKEKQKILDYIHNVTEGRQYRGDQRIKIKLSYSIDMSNISDLPEGIHHPESNLAFAAPEHRRNVRPLTRACLKPITFTTVDDQPAVTGSMNFIYVPAREDDTRPVYMTVGNSVIRIKPSPLREFKPGLHLIGSGPVGRVGNNPSEHIPFSKFAEYGVYRSIEDLDSGMKLGGRVNDIVKNLENAEAESMVPDDDISFIDDAVKTLDKVLSVFDRMIRVKRAVSDLNS